MSGVVFSFILELDKKGTGISQNNPRLVDYFEVIILVVSINLCVINP